MFPRNNILKPALDAVPVNVSGNEAAQGLIRSTVKGPDFLTGGNFGVESLILSLLL